MFFCFANTTEKLMYIGMKSRLKQARLPFVDRSEKLILQVPPGVGKTNLTVALGVKAADAGHHHWIG